jgi:hypothetical protein
MARAAMTEDEREAARRAKRADNLLANYTALMQQAKSPRRRLAYACDFLRSVAARADEEQVAAWAKTVTEMAAGGLR